MCVCVNVNSQKKKTWIPLFLFSLGSHPIRLLFGSISNHKLFLLHLCVCVCVSVFCSNFFQKKKKILTRPLLRERKKKKWLSNSCGLLCSSGVCLVCVLVYGVSTYECVCVCVCVHVCVSLCVSHCHCVCVWLSFVRSRRGV